MPGVNFPTLSGPIHGFELSLLFHPVSFSDCHPAKMTPAAEMLWRMAQAGAAGGLQAV